MPYVTIEDEVWVDLDDFDTEDLIEELKHRKAVIPNNPTASKEILNDIYMRKVRGQPYDDLVNELLYSALGKIC